MNLENKPVASINLVKDSGVRRDPLFDYILERQSKAEDSSFGEESVKITKEQSESAAAFGWLTTNTNTRLDQVKIGRIYERINLRVTELGIAMHPMSQVLQEYSDMALLQKKFKKHLEIPEGHTVQMLFRLGHATPVVHSPRKKVEALFRG